MRYVGRQVKSEGVPIDPKDLEAALQLREREQKNVGEVRALLGFLDYYRSFIQDAPGLEPVTLALYQLAWNIARDKKPFNEGEFVKNASVTLLKSCLLKTRN